MALDTQPLSRRRRLVMLALLLVLLGGSAAFAMLLVHQRQSARLAITVVPPPGFAHSGESAIQDEPILCPLLANINGGTRLFFIYFEPLYGADGERTVAIQAAEHFDQLFGVRPVLTSQTLAGYQGVQLRAQLAGHGGFGIIRAASIRGHFVAAVYSGDSAYAPADEQALLQLTGAALKIRVLPSR